MDISMPGLNGLVSLSEIARQFPRIKVLVLTMHEDMETVQPCNEGRRSRLRSQEIRGE